MALDMKTASLSGTEVGRFQEEADGRLSRAAKLVVKRPVIYRQARGGEWDLARPGLSAVEHKNRQEELGIFTVGRNGG